MNFLIIEFILTLGDGLLPWLWGGGRREDATKESAESNRQSLFFEISRLFCPLAHFDDWQSSAITVGRIIFLMMYWFVWLMIDSGEQNVYDLKKKMVLEPSHIIWTDSNTQGGDGDIDDDNHDDDNNDDNIHYKEGI